MNIVLRNTTTLLLGITSLSLTSCKNKKIPPSNLNVADVAGSVAENQDEVLFSLANWAKGNPMLKNVLGPYVATGGTHLELGDKSRFALQTNIGMSTLVNKGFIDKRSNVSGSYWADAFIMGTQVGGSSKGALLDIGLDANERDMRMGGHIRYIGKDMMAGKLASSIKKLLTRSLTDQSILYGSPLLGLKVGANIGGEFGVEGDLDRNIEDAMILGFTPKTSLNSALTGKVEVLKFSRAEIAGTVALLSTSLTTQGTVGSLRQEGLILGDVGMEGGGFDALDGQIVIGASAGLNNGLMPSGVDESLWKIFDRTVKATIATVLPLNPDWKWVHIVWDPKPISITQLPTFSSPFLNILTTKLRAAECDQNYNKLSEFVAQNSANLERLASEVDKAYVASGSKEEALEQRLRAIAKAKTNYQMIKGDMQKYCLKLR